MYLPVVSIDHHSCHSTLLFISFIACSVSLEFSVFNLYCSQISNATTLITEIEVVTSAHQPASQMIVSLLLDTLILLPGIKVSLSEYANQQITITDVVSVFMFYLLKKSFGGSIVLWEQ